MITVVHPVWERLSPPDQLSFMAGEAAIIGTKNPILIVSKGKDWQPLVAQELFRLLPKCTNEFELTPVGVQLAMQVFDFNAHTSVLNVSLQDT